MMKNAFDFMLKSSFRSWDIYIFCPDFFIEKRPGKKSMVNFKIYDITEWTTNNYNTHIVHYLKKQWKADNDIWSANGI